MNETQNSLPGPRAASGTHLFLPLFNAEASDETTKPKEGNPRGPTEIFSRRRRIQAPLRRWREFFENFEKKRQRAGLCERLTVGGSTSRVVVSALRID
jgi:hypothetical protein